MGEQAYHKKELRIKHRTHLIYKWRTFCTYSQVPPKIQNNNKTEACLDFNFFGLAEKCTETTEGGLVWGAANEVNNLDWGKMIRCGRHAIV